MLGQAAQLGCGGGGSTADAVDGACLCKNIDFSYGIIDCANAVCDPGVAKTVIQYGINWCAGMFTWLLKLTLHHDRITNIRFTEKGVIVSGLSATAVSYSLARLS